MMTLNYNEKDFQKNYKQTPVINNKLIRHIV